jgi:hypothetical protein
VRSIKGMAATAFYMVAGTAALGLTAWQMDAQLLHSLPTNTAQAAAAIPPADDDGDNGYTPQYLFIAQDRLGLKRRKSVGLLTAFSSAASATGTAAYGLVDPLSTATQAPLSIWRDKKMTSDILSVSSQASVTNII